MGMQKQAISYERQVYDALTFFGQVGGFVEFFYVAMAIMVPFLGKSIIETKIAQHYFLSTMNKSDANADKYNDLMGLCF